MSLRPLRAIAWILAVLLGGPTASSGEPLACRRAVSAGAAALARSTLATLTRCEGHRLATGGRAGDCVVLPRVVTKLADRRTHLERVIDRACGGADKHCGTADDEPLATLGWVGEACPGGTDPSCPTAVTDCRGVADCVACRAAAAARSVEDYYAATVGGDGAVRRCTEAIGREAARLLAKQTKALATCWDRRSRGKVTGDCLVEPKTSAAISAGRTRERKAVCRVCGGADHRCDGVNDVDATKVAFPEGCPAHPRADGSSCGGAIHDVSEVLDCTDCLTRPEMMCASALAGGGPSTYGSCRPSACCGPTRMVLVSEAGAGFTYGPVPITDVPPGARITVDVGPADSTCRHTVVVPPGGFTQPPFCVPGVSLSAELVAPGCPAGSALGRGTFWDGHAGPVDTDLLISGDTTDGVCSPAGQECNTDEPNAGDDVLGGLVIESGDGVPDTAGAHLRLELPMHLLTWQRGAQCPDP